MSQGPSTIVDLRTRVDRAVGRLRRPATSTRYLPEVDGLRAVSILCVLVFHAVVAQRIARGASMDGRLPFGPLRSIPYEGGTIERLVLGGRHGVEVFFVISGFILALPFIQARLVTGERRSAVRFYRRRLSRLEPPYVVALCIWAVVGWLAAGGPQGGTVPH